MSKRLLVDVEGLYAHSRDKLAELEHKGRRTGGIFGVVKTVDAAVRRFNPEVVVLCFGDDNTHVYLDDDAIKLGTWANSRGFHVTYLRGASPTETVKKVAIDMLGDPDENLQLIVQSWDESLNGLLMDKRVGLISLSDDDPYTHREFRHEHGFDVRFFARSQGLTPGDLVAVAPNPDTKTLRATLSDLGFDSVLEELDAGDVKLIPRRAISL